MAINLHWLRVFSAVAREGGFSRAARSIHVSQPAVSRTVRLLEEHLGVTLLDRSPAGVRLTEAGEILDRHARTIFAVERAAEGELKAYRGLERGMLRIGASTTVATYMLAPLLDAFSRSHPGIDLRVTSANTHDVVALLRSYDLDVALVEGPVEAPEVESIVWRDDELVVIAGADHPMSKRRSPRAEEIVAARFLVREPGSGTRAVTETAISRAGLTLSTTIELGSTEAIKQAVAAGLGLAIVSRAAVADQVALGRLKILKVPDLVIKRRLLRLVLAGRLPSAAAEAFDELVVQAGNSSNR